MKCVAVHREVMMADTLADTLADTHFNAKIGVVDF